MIISRATADDFEGIWPIFQKIISTGDTFVFAADTPKEVAYDYWLGSGTASFVAKKEQAIVGFYRLIPNQIDLGSHVANASFMVNPDYHRQGIGRALALHCLAEASRRGYKAMLFNYVKCTNEASVALYKSLGFNIVGTVPKAFKSLKINDYVDVYVMHRFLD